MSGGSKTQNQTTTSQAQIPDFLKPYLTTQANVGQQALTSLQSQLGGAGADQLVAGFTPNQLTGQNMAMQQVTSPTGSFAQANDILSETARGDYATRYSPLATQGIMAGMNAQNLPGADLSGLQSFASNQFQLPQTAQNALEQSASGGFMYGNPAFDEAVQASIRAARPSILSGYAGAGGVGAAKGGLAQIGMQQAASDAFARLYGDERQRQLSSAGQLGSFGLQGRSLQQDAASQAVNAALSQRAQDVQQQSLRNQASQGFGSLIDSERARQMQAAQSLPGIGLLGADVFQNIGAQEQALRQAQLTAPINAQNMLLSGASGGPNMMGLIGQSQTTPYTRNSAAGALGGALSGGALASTLGLAGPAGWGLAAAGGLLGLL